jgi:hypothetical protein
MESNTNKRDGVLSGIPSKYQPVNFVEVSIPWPLCHVTLARSAFTAQAFPVPARRNGRRTPEKGNSI